MHSNYIVHFSICFTDFWFSEESTFEALDLEISANQLQTLFDNLLSSGLKFDMIAVYTCLSIIIFRKNYPKHSSAPCHLGYERGGFLFT